MSDERAAGTAVRIQGASKRYGTRTVLDQVDFELAEGSVVGLLGRNGAGKTTLIRGLLGIEKLDAGRIEVLGADATRGLSDSARERLGYVPQVNDQFGWMSARELLRFWSGFYPSFDDALATRLLGQWKVPAKPAIAKLSGGERQMLAIVRALATRPQLLVLDEPVAALDPVARREFLRELIDSAIANGATVLFSTHIVSDLERVATHVAFLSRGRIRFHDEIERVRETLRRVLVPAGAGVAAEDLTGALAVRREASGALSAVFDTTRGGLDSALARCGGRASVQPIGLEDLFLELEA